MPDAGCRSPRQILESLLEYLSDSRRDVRVLSEALQPLARHTVPAHHDHLLFRLDTIPQTHPAAFESLGEIESVSVHHDFCIHAPGPTIIDESAHHVCTLNGLPASCQFARRAKRDVLIIDMPQQCRHNGRGTWRTKNLQCLLATLEPGGQNHICQVADVVVVMMSEEDAMHPVERDTSADELQDDTAPGVEEKIFLPIWSRFAEP